MRYFKTPTLPVSKPTVRSILRLEPGHWLDGLRRSPPRGFDQPTRTAMALSNDGRFIVYSAITEDPTPQGKPQIYLRRMDQMKAVPIAGTEGGISPFLSPDDRWVGFWAGGKLKKVPVNGGVVSSLCDVAWPFGFGWGSDNRIVFAPDEAVGLSRISADGGNPETLTAPDKPREEYSHRLPHCLPAGKGILFTIMRHGFDLQPRVAVLQPSNRKWRILLEDAADARYEEARYFLARMNEHIHHKKYFRFNLGAFLSAARSVAQYAFKQVEDTRNEDWYVAFVASHPDMQFLREKRNFEIHDAPVRPDHYGAILLDSIAVAPPSGGTGQGGVEHMDAIYTKYTFTDWTGPEDVPTLCSTHLGNLETLLAEGEQKGYLR